MSSSSKNLVVVVDPHPDFLEVLKDELQFFNFQVVAFEEVEAAKQFLEKNQVQVVISEVCFPKASGYHLMESCLSLDRKDHPEFILYSGDAQSKRSESLIRGASDFLHKPFHLEELRESLTKVLNQNKTGWGRRYFRVPVCLDVEPLGLEVANTVNVSLGGAFLATEGKIPTPGTLLKVNFKFRNSKMDEPISAIVKWVTDEEIGGLTRGYGIEFHAMNENAKRQLVENLVSMSPRDLKG